VKQVLFLNHNQENFGTYYRCFFLAKGLSENGFNVKMLCASGKKFDILIRRKKINDNFTIITLPRIKYHRYFTGQIWLRLPLILLFVLFSRYDICHAFTVSQPQIGIPAMVAKIFRKKRLIVDWDDLWGGGFADEHTSIVAKILGWSERYFIKYADEVTYVSELIGEEINKLKLNCNKTKIPNGANVEKISVLDKEESRRKVKLNEKAKLLISIGNTYTDSIGIMLEAFKVALREIPTLKLMLVGEGRIPEKFNGLKIELQASLLITGKKPFSDIPYYLASADCLILPMDDNNIEKARFPMRLGDYFCAGRPIVSNAVGEVKYYLEKYNAGLVSDSQDSQALARNIIKAINVSDIANEISRNARNLAETDLQWDNITDKLIKIY